MIRKHKLISILITLLLCFIVIAVIAIIRDLPLGSDGLVGGIVTEVLSPLSTKSNLNQGTGNTLLNNQSPDAQVQNISKSLQTASPSEFFVEVKKAPKIVAEGDQVLFSWLVNGPARTIRTSAVYYGKVGRPGNLPESISPPEVRYTEIIKDFLDGYYKIPLEFNGSDTIKSPGKYYFRGYALIDGRHIWSEEGSFIVNPAPKYEIRIIDPPTEIVKGNNISFTWEALGSSATTTFTTIVIGKLSKPGDLDATIGINQTPYAILINDFTNGSYNVPLRFIGNAKMDEIGQYYYRALMIIDNKNIWSPEYPLIVNENS